MKKRFISLIAILTVLSFCISLFACGGAKPESQDPPQASETTSSKSEETTDNNDTESTEISDTAPGSESTEQTSTETDSGNASETTVTSSETESSPAVESSEATASTEQSEGESEDDGVNDALEGIYGSSIEYSNNIANGVQAYYTDALRTAYHIENMNMSIDYSLRDSTLKQVTALKSSSGGTYIEDTMDIFVKMTNGKTYYASNSNNYARPNIFRIGYYYYDVHILDQNFYNLDEVSAREDVPLDVFKNKNEQVASMKIRDGALIIRTNGSDPFINTGTDYKFKTSDYNAITFSIKTDDAIAAQIFITTTATSAYNEAQSIRFALTPDGEYHTYTLLLSALPNYSGEVTSIRFDIESPGSYVDHYVNKIELSKISADAPALLVDRIFHTYSDKLHQQLHFVAQTNTSGITELGITTKIATERVDKLIVKDKNGIVETIAGVDWKSAEYVGFDIKNVGIFGYILPSHAESGKIKVEIVDEYYVITQYATPENGTIKAPVDSTENDYSMGHRIYTDENHSFDSFIIEAEFERNPGIVVRSDNFISYNPLNGAYEFKIGGTDFNKPFFNQWNAHYRTDMVFRGDNYDRKIYVRTVGSFGNLENAVVMSNDGMVLPIPAEVSKNFVGENEEPLYDKGDAGWGETVVALSLEAKAKLELTVLNVYQNWGNFPIKQLSSIQFFAPYYHLSLGVTETSCIAPWYIGNWPEDRQKNLWTLPDFRSVSAPYWYEMDIDNYQPQHTHAGHQYFLQYTDANGVYSASENVYNVIDSSGPIYADVSMTYMSDDGRIRVTYTHSEMPHTDEHRAFYEIEYEILDDISFTNFKNDFSFYSCDAYTGRYRKLGYLDSNNEMIVTDAQTYTTPTSVALGSEYPYVSLYDLKATGTWANDNSNLGFIIYDSDFVIGGESYEAKFALTMLNDKYKLTLDEEQFELKAGDKIKIDMIIMPWGSHKSTDDSNVRNVRANTCIDPLKVKVKNGEKIESTFIPKVRSTDGESVEFTLSGGVNNAIVRAYGFKLLTAPKIQELVDGEWVDYEVNSINSPDKMGNKNYYDGYYTYFDGDGTYSYAFVVNMDNVDERTFRVTANEVFKSWPAINDDGSEILNVLVKPTEISVITENAGHNLGEIVLDESGEFVRFYGNATEGEAYFTVFTNGNNKMTGQYAVIKYRVPSTVTEDHYFQLFTSTQNDQPEAADNLNIPSSTIVKDGEWHVIIVDISKEIATYKANDSGEYAAKYVRFDIFNVQMSKTSYVDIAYFGIAESFEQICELNAEEEDGAIISFGSIKETIDFESGVISPYAPEEGYIKPDSGYTQSSTAYVSTIDFINGVGKEDESSLNIVSNHKNGIATFDFNGPTTGEAYLAISGWTMVYEGAEKYVWSADGGKTWNDTVFLGRSDFSQISKENGIIAAANGYFAIDGYDSHQYSDKCAFQGNYGKPSGIAAKLDAYEGQTIDVIFAVVPTNEPETLCLLICVENVRVYTSDDDASEGEDDYNSSLKTESPYVDPESGYYGSTLAYVSMLDFINGAGDSGIPYQNIGAVSKVRVDSIDYSKKELGAKVLVISGWTMVQGGFDKIVWSVDGGKNWIDAEFHNRAAFGDASDAMCQTADILAGRNDFNKYAAASNYQGGMTDDYATSSGVSADLSEYAGQTVDIVFAAVPSLATDTLCILIEITGVAVPQ